MEKTLQELTTFLGGTLENDRPEMKVTGVNGLVEAGPGDISFAVPPYVEVCHKSKAGVMILAPDDPGLKDRPVIRVASPRAAFAALLELFRAPEAVARGVSAQACVSPKARIGKNVSIQAFVVVEDDAEIGDNTVLYPHVYVGRHCKVGADCIFYPSVTVRERCVVGNRVILQAGCVIGGDGFGFITTNGKHSKVPQTGNVILGDDVEIGCNTCIDRATVDSTIVGAGTKIDNLVHLGHNDVIGENCLLVIGDNCTFAGRAGIISDTPSNSIMAGFPAQPHMDWLRQQANLRKVNSMVQRLKALEKELAQLKK